MFKKAFLNNNIPVLMETAGEMHSVCIGIWVKVGSRYEGPDKNGISHFLEHMFFKGTGERTAQDIATEADAMGAELNALTSSEYTLFYIKILHEYLEEAIDLLTDIFINSTFPEDDLDKEKNIVTEEIKMVEDNPSDYVHDIFSRNIWGDQYLGQSVLGTRETINSFIKSDLHAHIDKFYATKNIVVSCCGNFQEERLVEYLEKKIGTLERMSGEVKLIGSKFNNEVHVLTKDLSEAHICLGLEGLPYNSEDRYAMHLLNTILGSGFSSRLFQNVREKRGLVYSIYSYHQAFYDTGLWAVYAGTDKKNVSEVVNISVDEIRNLSRTLTPEELQRAKTQLKGNLMLALESTSNRMTNIAKQEIYYGKYFSPDEIIKIVEAVTLDDVKSLLTGIVGNNPLALTVYGPVREGDITASCRT